jgi:uncharacterized protein YkwD
VRAATPPLILVAGVLASLSAMAVPGAAMVRKQPSVTAGRSLEAGLLAKINSLRAGRGLARLRLNEGLAAAAVEHSRQMARRGFFGHRSADGSSFKARVQRHYGFSGYRYWSAGENLLWSSTTISPSAVVEKWQQSPPHRSVLLAPEWRELGISVVRVDDAPGSFGGLDATIVTADFGARR